MSLPRIVKYGIRTAVYGLIFAVSAIAGYKMAGRSEGENFVPLVMVDERAKKNIEYHPECSLEGMTERLLNRIEYCKKEKELENTVDQK